MSNFKLLTIAILIIFNANLSLQVDQPCKLPNENQSTCIRLHHCTSVWNIVKNYTINNLPPNITALINKNAIECPQSNYVCCPFEPLDVVIPPKIIKTTTKPPTISTSSNNDICYLPITNRQSKCVRALKCKYIMTLVKPYPLRHLIPENVTKHIDDYKCPEKLNHYCCPDNAIYHFERSNLRTLRRHSRRNLINHNSCGSTSTDRIYGGENAELLEFPWAVILGHYDDNNGDIIYSCDGTLISSRYVVTAAHCVTNTLILARLGEHTISTQLDCKLNDCVDPVQDIRIERKIIHPQFDSYLRLNDIALLKLASPANLTRNNVKTICLPIHDEISFDKIVKNPEQNFTISGWGVTKEDKKGSDILKKASVEYVNRDECVNRYQDRMTIRSIHLCVGGGSNKTCHGDSGGGTTALANSFGRVKTYLYGVISGGLECENENSNYPSISTNIAFYLKWILDNMSPTSSSRYSSNNDFAFVYEE